MTELVEVVARKMHADRGAFDEMCYLDDELYDWQKGDGLTATVDGDVNFTALSRAAIEAVFAWLENPSEAAWDAFWLPGRDPFDDPNFSWEAMLAQMRKEALG